MRLSMRRIRHTATPRRAIAMRLTLKTCIATRQKPRKSAAFAATCVLQPRLRATCPRSRSLRTSHRRPSLRCPLPPRASSPRDRSVLHEASDPDRASVRGPWGSCVRRTGNGWLGFAEVDNSVASNMKTPVKILLSALSLAVAILAAAQPTRRESAAASPPAPPSAAAELNYQSAFTDYQPYKDIEPGNWKAANDTVGKAPGGQSDQSDHGKSMNSQPAPAPSSAHSGHPMGGARR